jgi:IPT/TIG domain
MGSLREGTDIEAPVTSEAGDRQALGRGPRHNPRVLIATLIIVGVVMGQGRARASTSFSPVSLPCPSPAPATSPSSGTPVSSTSATPSLRSAHSSSSPGSPQHRAKRPNRPQTTVPCVPASDAVVPLSGAKGYWLIVWLALLAALLWFFPTVRDARSVHRDRAAKLTIYSTLAAKAGTPAERRDIAKKVACLPVEGINALTRGLIALLVMTALIYVLLLLFGSEATVDSDLMKQAVTALLTTLTAVAAFYFGSRTAQTSGAGGSTNDAGGGSALPTISTFSPSSGPPGTEVTIEGSGLETTTKVVIGGALAPFRFDAGAEALIAGVPSGAATGKIEVTSSGGTGTSNDNFTMEKPP